MSWMILIALQLGFHVRRKIICEINGSVLSLSKFLSKSIGISYFKKTIVTKLDAEITCDIINMVNVFFLVKFSNVSEYDRVLLSDLWMVANHYLLVRGWSPNFDSKSTSIINALVWVRLSNFLVE